MSINSNTPLPPYVPLHSMPEQPQPYVSQQQPPMMYAAQPVPDAMNGSQAVYAQPIYGQPVSGGQHVVPINQQPQQQPQYTGFSDGLFDCFEDASSCLLACCVEPIRWAMTIERARLMTFIGAVLIYGGAYWGMVILQSIYNRMMCVNSVDVCADVPSWAPVLVGIFMVICYIVRLTLGTIYRGKIRQQHNIPGSAFEDCCLHLCCPCCAVAQEARHVDRMIGLLPHRYQQVQQQQIQQV